VDPATRSRLADHHLTQVLGYFARHADGADLVEQDGTLLFASAARFTGAFHAGAVRLDPAADPVGVLRVARRFAGARGRELMVWVLAHADADLAQAARAEGLSAGPAVVGMTIDAPPASPQIPADVDLVQVTDTDTAAQLAQVHRHEFAAQGRPVQAVEHFASPRVLLSPHVSAFVARLQGQPAACAMCLTTGEVAGIYWVATRADARRRGLGNLLTRTAVRAGFARGARLVVLHATDLGRPVYDRIGFLPFTTYHRFLLSVPQA
jgi:ribosomal protein S18 acetylase RimI-like enzyme